MNEKRPFVTSLAILAMALIAIAPTVSRLLDRPVMMMGHGMRRMADAGLTQRSAIAAHHHDHGRGAPDDCTNKCGYCDLLGHTPSLVSVAYAALFARPDGFFAAARLPRTQVRATFTLAADPRGPPIRA